MVNSWEYEPADSYYRRRREVFETEARKAAARRLMSWELAERGYVPQDFNLPTSVFDVSRSAPSAEPQEQKRRGGVLGLVGKFLGTSGDLLGDVTETVFRGPVNQPWDVLRPAVQAMEWEQEHIGRPLAENVISGLATPIRMARYGETPGQAFGQAKERYREEVPSWMRQVEEIGFSPSTWIGPGAIKGGVKMLTRAPLMEPLLGKAATQWGRLARPLPAVAGGAGATPDMARIFKNLEGLGEDVFTARDVQDVLTEARRTLSLTQQGRAVAGRILLRSPVGRWVEENPHLFWDSDIGFLWGEKYRLIGIGESYAARSADIMEAVIGRAFQLDKQGRALNVAGNPYLDDLIESYKRYDLTAEQQAVIKVIAEPLDVVKEMENAFGVKRKTLQFPAGHYAHRQVTRRPVNVRDILSLEEREQLVSAGPAVKQRLGAKQAMAKPREVATHAEGVEAGIEYMPFVEAQRARIEQGFHAIADKWVEAAVGPLGRKPGELVSRGVMEPLVATAKRVGQLKALERALVGAKKGAYFQRPRGLSGELEELAIRAQKEISEAGAAGASKSASRSRTKLRRQAAERLLEEVRGRLGEDAKRLSSLRAQRTREMEHIRAGGTRDFPRLFHGKYFPEQIGQELQRLDRPPGYGVLESTVNRFNNLVRPVMATLDLSFLGVQGLLGLARNPKGYAQAFQLAVLHPAGYEALVEAAAKSGLLEDFIRHGGYWAARNDLGEFLLRGPVTKIPGAQTANTWFVRFGNVMRLKLYEAGLPMAGSPTAKTALARFAGKATGYVAGKPTSIETAMLFAPRFFRAQLGLLADAVTKGDIAGKEARKTLALLLTEGSLLTLGINKVLGNETVLDPRSSNFMRIRTLGQDISVFGTWDSLLRAAVTAATRGPVEGGKYFARSKASPAVARMWDVFSGETWGGEAIDWSSPESALVSAAALGRQLMPISLQSAFEEGMPTTPQELGGAAIQFLGTKSTPLTPWEKLGVWRDKAAEKLPEELLAPGQARPKKWQDLEPFQQRELERRIPELAQRPEATSETGKALAERRAITEHFKGQQRALDEGLPPGLKWREAYKELKKREAGAYEDWERRNPKALSDRKPGSANDEAIDDYYRAFKEAKTPWGELDVDLLDQKLGVLETSWTPEQKAYVERNTGLTDSPTIKAYREAQKVLAPYWEIKDQIWQKLRERPEFAQYKSQEDYQRAKQQELVERGLAPDQVVMMTLRDPVVSEVERAVQELRLRYRAAHPEADEALATWYGAVPLAMQAQRPKSKRMVRRRGPPTPPRPPSRRYSRAS